MKNVSCRRGINGNSRESGQLAVSISCVKDQATLTKSDDCFSAEMLAC